MHDGRLQRNVSKTSENPQKTQKPVYLNWLDVKIFENSSPVRSIRRAWIGILRHIQTRRPMGLR